MDLHDYIQQSADDVDFKSIGKMLVDTRDNVIDHFSLNGEVMDVTKLPRNIHEYEQMHNTMLKEFNNLPAELKVLFQDDFNLFANAWKSGKIGSILDAHYKNVASTTDTSKTDESEVK